jgi:hypothetical protein
MRRQSKRNLFSNIKQTQNRSGQQHQTRIGQLNLGLFIQLREKGLLKKQLKKKKKKKKKKNLEEHQNRNEYSRRREDEKDKQNGPKGSNVRQSTVGRGPFFQQLFSFFKKSQKVKHQQNEH